MSISKDAIYDSAKRGPVALEELRGVFQYRGLILQLIRKDVVARYKRSVLGVAWTMLHPLGMMIILSLVFSTLYHRQGDYPAYILSGLIAWSFFSQTTNGMISQIVWGGALMRKIYVPHTSFAVASVGTGMVNLALSFVPLFLIVLLVGIPIRWSILFLPVSMLLLAAFALGVGLIISTVSIYFPDVSEMYSLVLIGWMYMTPIIYPETLIPESYRYWFFRLNPMYYYLKIFRAPVYDGMLPEMDILLPAVLISILALTVGWLFFSKKSDDFAYHL
ncbi:MAG: ABC transporter permease [Chloroflexi bacterium]|nr:ABC transporter permease [Chloroflexota bacterium]